MKNLVVLTGAGISAESGIRTFREMGGLWEEYDIMEVASYDGWINNMPLVNDFYNQRRKQLFDAKPNYGHTGLVELEKYFNVEIVTQNVDDLHEKAGSKNVLHLHGELKKVRSSVDPDHVVELDGWELKIGDTCPKGSQLRPHVVWFGEPVPAMGDAVKIVRKADVFVIIGTSLNVYPAAGLLDYAPASAPVFLIDPNDVPTHRKINFIKEKASTGVKILIQKLKPLA